MELLFEIGCEDLPSRFVSPALTLLERNFRALAEEYRLSFTGLSVEGTPRRLVLMLENLDEKQGDLSEERTGPPAGVAFKDGQPTKAAVGFAKGLGVAVEDLYTVETPKGEYVAARVFEAGRPTVELLEDVLMRCIDRFNFLDSMRWADDPSAMRFARPIRWVVAVYGGQPVVFNLANYGYGNVISGNVTRGHRFSPKGRDKEIEVSSISQYKQALTEYDVVLEMDARRATIEELLKSCAEPAGGTVVDDPGLLEEVVNLVEKPHGVLLTYDESYLELPDEVLLTSMRSHQRYFAVAGEDGRLLNSCVIIYNTPVKDPVVVRDGNYRVLRARLDDAKFFWNQDLKHPFESYNEELKNVTWIKEIGNVADRAARIATLAEKFAKRLGYTDDVVAHARRAGELSKADLATSMVFEFTDLQGTMGREYARKNGEREEVAVAISEQYMPRSVDDGVPTTDAGSAVALAEKLDALVGCFGSGMVPTSTSDPYALRRAAIGVVKILQEANESVSLGDLINDAYSVYVDQGTSLRDDLSAVRCELESFIATRLENQLALEYPLEIVQAVLSLGVQDVAASTARVAALATIRDQPDFQPLAAGFKRVVNLVKKDKEINSLGDAKDFDAFTVDQSLLVESAEKALYATALAGKMKFDKVLVDHDYAAICGYLIELKEPIDNFFDEVMVMAEDDAVRRNRLQLLAKMRALFFTIGDLSVIN